MKRHTGLRGLSDDHHTALIVALRCKRAEEASLAWLWKAVRSSFASHLEPHFAIEETHLLPALEELGEGALADRIREDHARLRRLGGADRPSLAHVREFGRALDEHVRFEERRVFQETQDRLPAESLAALEAACAESPRLCAVELVTSPAPER